MILSLAFVGIGSRDAAAQDLPAVAPSLHSVERVPLLSLDGLHALDLANYVRVKPNSTSRAAQPAWHYVYKCAFLLQLATSEPLQRAPANAMVLFHGRLLSKYVLRVRNARVRRLLSPPGTH